MLLRRFTDFLLKSRLQAMAMVFALAFVPFFGILISVLITAFITLRKGAWEGALILIASIAPYGLIFLAPGLVGSQQMSLALGLGIISSVLTWFFAVVLRKFNNWSFTLELATLLGVLVVGIIHIIYPDVSSWWAAQLKAYATKTTVIVERLQGEDATQQMQKQLEAITAAKNWATGVITASVLLNVLIQLLVARWWQAALYNPGGLRKELYQIRLGHVVALVFAIEIILSYWGNGFAIDTLPILYTAFFFAGLSLMHYAVSVTKNPWIWIIAGYGIIFLLAPLSFIVVGIIALFDTGFDFRKRFIEKR